MIAQLSLMMDDDDGSLLLGLLCVRAGGPPSFLLFHCFLDCSCLFVPSNEFYNQLV